MKIGIDIRAACGNKTGKGWYTFHLIKELLKLDRENNYILYTNKITSDIAWFGNANIKVIHAHPLMWHFAVIKDFARGGGEIFFSPTSYIIPAFLPKKITSVITVHDLVAFLHPLMHQTKATILEQIFFRIALRKISATIVPSKNTARDLMRLFRFPEKRIFVTPLGVDEAFFKEETASHLAEIKSKYNLPREFILTVGGLEPRKNINLLIDAKPELPIVIVGGKGWKSAKLQKKIRAAGKKVLQIENIDAADLPLIYKLAKVFVFPSLYEGFGLPPLEAMASGCPVICSNAGSLTEVVGDAAITFDPNNCATLAAELHKILSDGNLRKDLIARGKRRAKQFPWKITAEKTLNVILSLSKDNIIKKSTNP